MAVKRNLSAVDLRTIGGRLRHLRSVARKRQVDVATAIGAHPVQLSEWEKGKWTPKAATIQRLADYFGVPSGWIVTGGPVPETAPDIKSSTVPRGTHLVVSEAKTGYRKPLPADLAEAAQALEREMARLGATDEELDYVQSVLTLPEGLNLAIHAPTPQERERRFQSQVGAVRALVLRWVAERAAAVASELVAKASGSIIPMAKGKPIDKGAAKKRRRPKAG